MAEPVKIVSTSGESQGAAKTEDKPWSVVELSFEGDETRTVEWQVIISLPSHREALPLVFESQDAALAWTERVEWTEEEWGEEFPWDVLTVEWDVLSETVAADASAPGDDAMDLTNRFLKFAQDNGLEADSLEAWERAHELQDDEKLFHSLAVFDGPGCYGNLQYLVPAGLPVRLPFLPSSCRSRGRSALYDPVGAQLWAALTPVNCAEVPLNAQFAFTTGY